VKRIIINRPELQSPLQRVTTRGITLVFWMIWIYLWLPLISLAAWLAGIRLFREHMLDNDGYKALFSDMHEYALVIAFIAIVLIGWARYNLVRFRGEDNRKTSIHADLASQAQRFNIPPQQLRDWQETRRLVIQHGKQGEITDVETGTPALATSGEASMQRASDDQLEQPPSQI
jgi:biofilm PGA synthesis protein PgaD